ncbi:hypothetical protein RY831_32050 [Noviherbaspirillum sp. CPCC 100848]|uniref:Uncharacterized protein n=1 Tax=Noviherbaspirillum album TaxID=3080276 RepID=A0ABU6JJ77_9BURK|nr:hypothetical protein [Noviherbaspirillum sp. CPCC 100848]MEC4723758.1 hypothetical protein [Noviherbaspirillum sp. CPCC 100848]
MPPLDAIKTACQQALEASDQNADWRAAYCEVVDPASVLNLVEQLESHDSDRSTGERTAFIKLVRDLTGYIKLTTGDKPDPVREDLLLQAKEILAQFGG